MSGVARTRWAWLLAAYAVAGVAARLGLGVGPPHDTAADQVLVPLVLPVVGAACLLLVRLPGHGVTRVLALVAVATVTRQWLDVVQHRMDGPVADRVLDALTGIAWTGEVPALALLVLLFPTGRPPGPRWRVVLRAQLAALGLLVAVAVVLDTTSPLIPFLAAPAGSVLLATTAAAAWSLVLRWRRSDPDERAGMRGFVLLAVVLVACYAISGTAAALGLPAPVADGLWSLLFAGLPVAVAYGVLRHRLYDIDVVVRRVAVWAVLSAALLGIYLGVAVGIDTLLGGRRGIDLGTLVAAAVVALGLAPLRRLLQVGVDRLLYGRRGDPDDMVRRAARELAAAGAAADVPQRLAELLTTSLRLPWAAVELDREGRWERVAHTGAEEPAPEAVLVVAMSTAGEVPARLLLSARRGERLLSSRDRAVLDDLAVQLAPALLSVRLVDELERSRERLLRAGIEERQRLRHDLHDTLSPALGGMRLALAAARRLLPTDPDGADVLLAAVRAETERTGDAVQRMLARLRPAPIGDADADLLAAVVAHGDQLAERAGLQVVVGAEGLLPTLPPAVIEAAYRIAVEAMTNTARHAAAHRCTVSLRAAEELTVEVSDDGCGLPEPLRPGVGWESMRRRADELGGRCEIAAAVGGGTRVLARPAACGAAVIRVLVVEDHPMYREGLRASLALDGMMEVVAAVGTAADAVAAVTRYPVDVVLMDLQLPDGSGVAATREVLTRRQGCRVLVLSSHDDEITVTAAVRAGARGYLTKDADGAEIARAVHALAAGDSMFTGTVVDALARGLVPRTGPAASAFPQLTGREREVLALLAAGHSNAFIADHFVLSLKTVRNHVSSTFAKLGVASRAEAIVAARRAGLGESAPPYPD